MLCFHDTTYCASPNCANQCGRKFTQALADEAIASRQVVAFAYFCGSPGDEKEKIATEPAFVQDSH